MIRPTCASAVAVAKSMCVFASPSGPSGPGSLTPPHMCAALSTPGRLTNRPLQPGSFSMMSRVASVAQMSPPS